MDLAGFSYDISAKPCTTSDEIGSCRFVHACKVMAWVLRFASYEMTVMFAIVPMDEKFFAAASSIEIQS
jgi:hypothetical protein